MNARPVRGPADANAVAHVFVDALDDRCEITGDDGHHLQRVRRLTAGEIVTAADGSGAWRTYAVTEVADRPARRSTARGEVEIEPEPPIGVSLAVALTKGGLDDVVAAVTELGVVRVTPVRTARAVVRWDDARARRAVDPPPVRRPGGGDAEPPGPDPGDRRGRRPRRRSWAGPDLVVADHGGVGAVGAPAARPGPARTGLDGPGRTRGWPRARGAGRARARPPRLRLGPHVLRAATAPIAAVAVLTAEAARLRPE